jgi:dienelactone hydrolase
MANFSICPDRPVFDTELWVRLSDLPAGAAVVVRAEQADVAGRGWRSAASFVADRAGTVDLRRDAPAAGGYAGIDPMGLIWSLEPGPDAGTPGAPLDPVRVRFTAEVDGVEVAAAQVERAKVAAGLVRTDVSGDGLVGVLYRPAGDQVLPGVLTLGGSEGGLHELDAAVLAAHGYAVLALAYAGLPGVPPTLRDIPLEYFGRAVEHLRGLPGTDPARIAVVGTSKGGEAALLAGATFPAVRGVVSYVGSGLVTQGISQSIVDGSFLEILATPVPNWTYRGQPLPYVPTVVTPQLAALVAAGGPVPLRMAFEPGLTRPEVTAATIPVERINGPVLLISGADDQGPGPAYHDIAAKRLASHHHRAQHIVYPDAGHLIGGPPYAPTTMTTTPGPGIDLEHGGTPAATARARADAWQQTLALLADLPGSD